MPEPDEDVKWVSKNGGASLQMPYAATGGTRPIWPEHEKYNVKEYSTRIEGVWDQRSNGGQRGREASDKL
jgi:hypothetical protein